LYGFELTAPQDSGGQTMRVSLSFDGKLLTARDVPIGVDRWLAEGTPVPHGGCGLASPARSRRWLLAPLLLLGLRQRRRRR
jgi:hypothetical protein